MASGFWIEFDHDMEPLRVAVAAMLGAQPISNMRTAQVEFTSYKMHRYYHSSFVAL